MLRTIFLAASSVFVLAACGGEANDATDETDIAEANKAQDDRYDGLEAVDGDDTPPTTMDGADEEYGDMDHAHDPLPAPASGEDARVSFIGTDGEETGEVVVTGGPNGILLRIDVMDIAHGFHGIHLHQVADCSDYDAGFKLSGSHINPQGNEHGLMNEAGYELADLPNVYAHHSGHARAEVLAAGLMLEDAMDDDGFAVVVHENPDDHQTQPIGGAGARVACAAFGGMAE